MSLPSRLIGVGVVGVLAAGGLVTPTSAAPARPAAAVGDVTSAPEARRVDRVATPALAWYRCDSFTTAQCATVRLPLDYDDPHGPTVQLAMLRIKARKPKARIGTLFVNPGGPGGSGVSMAESAPYFLSDPVLDRFDVVGFDPRGIGASDNLKCFATTRETVLLQSHMDVMFPYGKKEETEYLKGATTIGRACSTTGAKLAGAMSTAESARDMDVLRRAVGDRKLTYLGFSYGTVLGQYYANMFPDRVRALALDGVINPLSWTGQPVTQNLLQDDRLRSADASYRALRMLLLRCDHVGVQRCAFAAGDPLARFAAITRRLRARPLVLGKDIDGRPLTITYADFVGLTLLGLYTPFAGEYVPAMAVDLETLLAHPGKATAERRAAAQRALRERLTALRAPSRDFPYENSLEAFAGVVCTDALHPAGAARWPALTAAQDARAPYFGRAWSWGTAQCARDTWTVRDEDAHRGPFNRRTGAPVLFVGNYWDPATSYRQAETASRLLPNSRLLSSDNFGHTAYGTSACVTTAVDAYLLRGTVPPVGRICHSQIQPFAPVKAIERGRRASAADLTRSGAPAADASKRLPPVGGPFPAVLAGSRS